MSRARDACSGRSNEQRYIVQPRPGEWRRKKDFARRVLERLAPTSMPFLRSRINACFAFDARCALDARSARVASVVFVHVGAVVASMCAYACVFFVVATYLFSLL